ncbi:hypothetical protein DAI22_05g220400 [Oryza sativa Japonica Group]|nr:hypothetical protein DAI22_05g220400 [Oryza sativa Japonica Group]
MPPSSSLFSPCPMAGSRARRLHEPRCGRSWSILPMKPLHHNPPPYLLSQWPRRVTI